MGYPQKYVLLFVSILNLVVPAWHLEDVRNVSSIEENHLNRFLENSTLGRDQDLEACDCGWRNKGVLHIVGGNETGINEFPAMAALININTQSLYCGSIIISDRYLLTAGHCVYQKPASSLAVLVGDHNISSPSDTPYSAIYLVNAYEINEDYLPSTYENDIAIVQTKTSITFSAYVGPICLPFRYSTASFYNQAVIILGWGQIEFSGPNSDVLLKATLGVLSNTQCAAVQTEIITAGEICTYADGKDSCQSDSGGPLLWTDSTTNRMHSIGIISHGRGCASSYPGINTRVTAYLGWILSRTPDANYCYM